MASNPSSSSTFTLEGLGLKLDDANSLTAHIGPLLDASAPEKITQVILSGNTIGVPAAEALAPHLAKLKNLKVANFADIFTSRLLSEIPPALEALLTPLLDLKGLHTVNLSDNAFGLKTQAPLVRFLEKHTPLRHLFLNNNGLGPEAGSLVADALSRLAVAKKEKGESALLETVVCGRNRLETGSMAAWAKAYTAHAESIREVKMVQNGIRQEGIRTLLLEGLCKAKNLEVLDLQDNTFTWTGAQALAKTVQNCTKLKELGISDSYVSARGMVILSEALAKKVNTSLEVLRLQYNNIDIKGVKALNDLIETEALPRLRRVELNGNKFAEDDPAIEQLGESLKERKKNAGSYAGVDKDDEDAWGLDELDELEDEDSEEEEDDEEEEDEKKEGERELKAMDEAESANVPLQSDKDVDDLADKLGKTGI